MVTCNGQGGCLGLHLCSIPLRTTGWLWGCSLFVVVECRTGEEGWAFAATIGAEACFAYAWPVATCRYVQTSEVVARSAPFRFGTG